MVTISNVAVVAQCALQTLKTNIDTTSSQKCMKLPITGRIAKIIANAADRHDNGFVVNF